MSNTQPMGTLRSGGPSPTISYSLLAAMVRHQPLDQAISEMELAGVGAVHFDTADELVTLDANLSAQLRSCSVLPFDFHVAMRFPNGILDQLALRVETTFALTWNPVLIGVF